MLSQQCILYGVSVCYVSSVILYSTARVPVYRVGMLHQHCIFFLLSTSYIISVVQLILNTAHFIRYKVLPVMSAEYCICYVSNLSHM